MTPGQFLRQDLALSRPDYAQHVVGSCERPQSTETPHKSEISWKILGGRMSLEKLAGTKQRYVCNAILRSTTGRPGKPRERDLPRSHEAVWHTLAYMYMYMYTSVHTEKEGDRQRGRGGERERERERERFNRVGRDFPGTSLAAATTLVP